MACHADFLDLCLIGFPSFQDARILGDTKNPSGPIGRYILRTRLKHLITPRKLSSHAQSCHPTTSRNWIYLSSCIISTSCRLRRELEETRENNRKKRDHHERFIHPPHLGSAVRLSIGSRNYTPEAARCQAGFVPVACLKTTHARVIKGPRVRIAYV